MNYIVSQIRENKVTGKTSKSYYMGMIEIPMFGSSLQSSPKIIDAKQFDTEEEAKLVLSVMGKNSVVEPLWCKDKTHTESYFNEGQDCPRCSTCNRKVML